MNSVHKNKLAYATEIFHSKWKNTLLTANTKSQTIRPSSTHHSIVLLENTIQLCNRRPRLILSAYINQVHRGITVVQSRRKPS